MAASDLISIPVEFTDAELDALQAAAGSLSPDEFLRQAALALAVELGPRSEDAEDPDDEIDAPRGSTETPEAVHDEPLVAVGVDAVLLERIERLEQANTVLLAWVKATLTELCRQQAFCDILADDKKISRAEAFPLSRERAQARMFRIEKVMAEGKAMAEWLAKKEAGNVN